MPWTLLGLVAVLAIAAASVSAATTSGAGTAPTGASGITIPTVPFTGFGGYNWFGATTSVGAAWVVPTIVSSRRDARAATWIGAQNSSTLDFIQIGTIEELTDTGRPRYEAFWSDTSLHFEAQPIAAVDAGDNIAVSMTRTGQGWRLGFVDRTRNWTRTIASQYGRTGVYTQGEWLHEDPPPSLDSAHDGLYPVTTVVRFTGVTVDGSVPSLPYDDAQALSGYGGVDLVPTVFADDAFSLPPARGAAQQYLIDAARFDSVVAGVDAQAAGDRATPTTAQDLRAVVRLIAALHTFNAELRGQSWPAAADPDITHLVAADTEVAGDFQKVRDAGLKESRGLAGTILRDYTEFHLMVATTRAQLGLPPTEPDTGPQ
jgi:hypothetical protein